ncbi:MAG: hypothetical protein Q7J47_11680 [Azoarcus sp.]|nr:hypothetical protein [Azoarcus sp.]
MPASPAQGPTPGGVSPAAPAAGDETSTPATATPSSTFAPAQASAAAPAPDQPDTRSANARTQPAALLPPIVQDAHSSRSSPAAASAQRTPAAADGPTEVHVHIGRVEVTAVQAPAAPKPSARSGPQPMSLDDYLARRQRRGS